MEKQSTLDRAWSTIASTTSPLPLLYLDTLSAIDFGQTYKRQSFDRLDVKPGHQVLDVGCGPGDDVRALAERTGTRGKECGLTEIAVTTGAFVLTDYVLADRLWGLERNALRARDAGIISESERLMWVESLRRAAEHGYFLGTASGFGVFGVKS